MGGGIAASILLSRYRRIIMLVARCIFALQGVHLRDRLPWGWVVAVLRIRDVPAAPTGSRRVRVSWRDERAVPQEAEAVFAAPSVEGDGERVRWYLEDYAEFPADPAPVIAREAERWLARTGEDLFRAVFADPDAAQIWERVRDRLPEVRVEVDADPGEGPGLAWELLRDPGSDQPVALGAGAFVRTHLPVAGRLELPEPSEDRLRVLLVIARPGGRDDVPFRSVASRMVRGGAEHMEGLDLDVLRPATFARLCQVLHTAHEAGRPYHVVHFDGHGTWLDLADLGAEPNDGVSVARPVREGQHGYLLFEEPASDENRRLVDGPTLGRLLTDTDVPVLVLNACRSAYSEALGQPADTAGSAPDNTRDGVAADSALVGEVHARIRAYGSLAAEVAAAGVPGVVAMRYNVFVVTAAQFMADLYAHLFTGRSLGEAAAAARHALAADPIRQIGAPRWRCKIGPCPSCMRPRHWCSTAPAAARCAAGQANPGRHYGRPGRRGGWWGAAAAGCGVLRPGRDAASPGPGLRHPAHRAAARLRGSRKVLDRGRVRPLVPDHRRPRPSWPPGVAGGCAVVLV